MKNALITFLIVIVLGLAYGYISPEEVQQFIKDFDIEKVKGFLGDFFTSPSEEALD